MHCHLLSCLMSLEETPQLFRLQITPSVIAASGASESDSGAATGAGDREGAGTA